MNKKTILFYGDSNTHGTKPMHGFSKSERFNENERWTGILREQLKDNYFLIEEGLPARTTVHNDPIEGIHKNGLSYLRPCLESHYPIDIFVLMLGTNDLKARFSVTPADIAFSVDQLILTVKSCQIGPNQTCPKLVLLCPPPIKEVVGGLGDIFVGGEEKSKLLGHYYQQVAQKHHSAFLDLASVVTVSNIDGIHYDQDQHIKLAQSVKNLIENL